MVARVVFKAGGGCRSVTSVLYVITELWLRFLYIRIYVPRPNTGTQGPLGSSRTSLFTAFVGAARPGPAVTCSSRDQGASPNCGYVHTHHQPTTNTRLFSHSEILLSLASSQQARPFTAKLGLKTSANATSHFRLHSKRAFNSLDVLSRDYKGVHLG